MKKLPELQFLTNHSAKHTPSKPRKLSKDSQTVAGESFTVQELFNRAVAQGQLESPQGNYMDIPLDEITHMYRRGLDLVDVQDHKALVQDLETQLEALNKAQADQKKLDIKTALDAQEKIEKTKEADKAKAQVSPT